MTQKWTMVRGNGTQVRVFTEGGWPIGVVIKQKGYSDWDWLTSNARGVEGTLEQARMRVYENGRGRDDAR